MKDLFGTLTKNETIQKRDYEEYTWSELKFPLLSASADVTRADHFDIPYGPDELQQLDIHHLRNSSNNPVIVFIHGGGWSRRDKDQSRFFVPFLINQGYTVVSINYRLTDGEKEDLTKRNPHPMQIDDCARALKWITDNIGAYGGNPHNIALIGHSAGGHLSALLVSDVKWHKKYDINIECVKCWIGLSGIYDLTLKENYSHEWMPIFIDFLIDEERKLADASPINYFKGTEPPCLLLHGRNDYLVPLTNAIHLYDKLIKIGVTAEIEILKDAAHMNYFSKLNDETQRATKLVNQFLGIHLQIQGGEKNEY